MFDDDLKHGRARREAFRNLPLNDIEVHSDRKARLTGKFYLEVSSHGKESGISTTVAKYWAIELSSDCWAVVPTARLKKIANHQKGLRGTTRGGDGGAAEGVLIPLAALFLDAAKPKRADVKGQMALDRKKVG
jgi:hypothetical protein